jgi:hypothetical protein
MNALEKNKRRPPAVTLAVVTLAVIIAISLVRRIVRVQAHDLHFYFVLAVVFLLGTANLWFILRGRNWARWLLLASFFLGAAFKVPEFIQRVQSYSALQISLHIGALVIELMVLFALFHPSASRWFRGHAC